MAKQTKGGEVMPRYIDADALKEEVSRIYYLHYAKTLDKTISDFFNAVDKRIKGAPTVDAEPVRHGLWKGNGMGDHCCSLCGEEVSGHYYAYCPYCGAKMEVE